MAQHSYGKEFRAQVALDAFWRQIIVIEIAWIYLEEQTNYV